MTATQTTETDPGQQPDDLGEQSEDAPKIAAHIGSLRPGAAAHLRLRPLRGAGIAAVERILTRYRPTDSENERRGWTSVVQAIAILTPRTASAKPKTAHDGHRPLGAVLAAAGIGENRLNHLLAAKPAQRQELFVQMCHWLAARKFRRLNTTTLAALMLEDTNGPCRETARDYFKAKRRIDHRKMAADKS